MALNTVTITKNGGQIEIVGYSNNGSVTTAKFTITNPTGVKIQASGDVITIDPVSIAAWTFDQSGAAKAKNEIVEINGVDVTSYDTSQVVDALNAAFATSFANGINVMAQDAVVLTLTTDVSGTAFVAFASSVCNCLDIVNASGTALEYKRNSGGNAMQVPDQSSRLVVGITNANQISMRRVDVDTTPVTITAEAITA